MVKCKKDDELDLDKYMQIIKLWQAYSMESVEP